VIEYTCKKYGKRKIRTGDDGLDAHIGTEIDKEASKDIDQAVSTRTRTRTSDCVQCYTTLEAAEENLENWYFHKQTSDPDLRTWLCIDTMRLCCAAGHYGKECSACPTTEGAGVCSGHGKCNVSAGGKCTPHAYRVTAHARVMASARVRRVISVMCVENALPITSLLNRTILMSLANVRFHFTHLFIGCTECHRACDGPCKSAGEDGCEKCKSGWLLTPKDDGTGTHCKGRHWRQSCLLVRADIDECASEVPVCAGEHMVCTNTEGAYSCGCENAYKMDKGECVLDVTGKT
jgi:hypothetical protein